MGEKSKSPYYLSPSDRVFQVSLVLYCPVSFMLDCIFRHSDVIEAYAFCYHDSDEKPLKDSDGNIVKDSSGNIVLTLKEPHIHLLLVFRRRVTCSVLKRWFYRIDDKGLVESVLFEKILDRASAFDYLIHKYHPDKYQYPEERRIFKPDISYFSDFSDSLDTLSSAFFELKRGVPIQTLVCKYGRDFLLHLHNLVYALDYERSRDGKSSQSIDFLDPLNDFKDIL